MRVYTLWFEGDDGYSYRPDDEPFLIGIYSELGTYKAAMMHHARTFKTNNGEPLDFSSSQVVVHVANGMYFGQTHCVDNLPDYSMRTN